MAAALVLARDFGPSWDVANGDYAYGQRTLAWLLDRTADLTRPDAPIDLPQREPAPALFATFGWHQLYPFASTLSAATAQVGYHETGILPPFVALHLPIFAGVALLVVALFRVLGPRIGIGTVALATALLLTAPRFVAHAMYNLKDAPETVLYTLAALAGYEALAGLRRTRDWVALGVFTGCALAQKANALFLPLQLLAFVAAGLWLRRRCTGDGDAVHVRWRGALAAAVAFAAVYAACSPAFWTDPLARLGHHFGAQIAVACPGGGAGGLEFAGVVQVALTTPLPLLALAAVGAVAGRAPPALRAFLIVAAATPMLRTMLPGLRNFDGVRHFLEFYPPLAVLAALGAMAVGRAAARFGRPRLAWTAVVAVAVGPALAGAIGTWPHPQTWHDPMVAGGLRGARAMGLRDATDYWAVSYWQGLDWLRDHASAGALVVVPVAGHVARCAAPVRAPGLDVREAVEVGARAPASLFVMYVIRPGFFGRYVRGLDADGAASVVHRIEVQGAEILRIHRFDEPAEVARQLGALTLQTRANAAMAALAARLLPDAEELAAEALATLRATPAVGEAATLERLRTLLPAELHPLVADAVWLHAR